MTTDNTSKKKSRKRRVRGEGGCHFNNAKQIWRARAIVGVKPNGQPKYKEVSARTQGEALAKKRKLEEDAKAGLLPDGKPMNVGDWLQHWLDNVAKPSVRESTWESYERCVRLHLKPRIGGYKLGQLRPHHVEKFFADLDREGMSRGNAKKVSEVLASALEHAVLVGSLPNNPTSPVHKPQPEEKAIEPFTPEEAKKIIAEAEGIRLYALVALAFATGARQGELLCFGWDHLDIDKATLRIEQALSCVKNRFIVREPKSKRGKRIVEPRRFAVDATNPCFRVAFSGHFRRGR
jgi:integrase